MRGIHGDGIFWQKLSKRKETHTMNKTKTWKIGEECVGGIIQAKISENAFFPLSTTVKILVKEWKTGEIIHSDIFGRIHVGRLSNHLHEMTTSYYASKIMDWVKENAFTHRVLVAMEGGN
jgi:hypothetical protein